MARYIHNISGGAEALIAPPRRSDNIIFADPMNGTAGDDFIFAGFGQPPGTTLNGHEGDDFILADINGFLVSRDSVEGANNHSVGTAQSFDHSSFWSLNENPLFGNDDVPHATIYVSANAGQQEYFALSMFDQATITIDIDFAFGAVGDQTDTIVELIRVVDDVETVVASNDDNVSNADGGFGSLQDTLLRDSFLSYFVPEGAGGTYYIRVKEFDFGDSNFEGGEEFLINVSAQGHGLDVTPDVAGADILHGGDGHDSLFGVGGDDVINGNADNDELVGGSGDDILAGGAGDDVMNGGVGGDMFLIDAGTGPQSDTIRDSGGTDTVCAAATVIGVTIDDIARTVTAGDATATWSQNGLIERFIGSANNDIMTIVFGNFADGGDGEDTLDYSGAADATGILYWNLATGLSTTGLDEVPATALVNFEHLDTGAMSTDFVRGTDASNIISTFGLDDHAEGGGGADTIDGGAGDDTLSGGAGDDILTGGIDDDIFLIDSGTGVQNDTINGGEGIDTANAAASTVGVTIDDLAQTIVAGDVTTTWAFFGDIERYIGSAHNDVMTIAIGEFADGGAGQDTLDYSGIVRTSAPILYWNLATGLSATSLEDQNPGNALVNFEHLLTVQGAEDVVRGTAVRNIIQTFDLDDIVDGGGGNDTLRGGDGDDMLHGGMGRDGLNGGTGADTADYGGAADGVTVRLATPAANEGEAAGDTYRSIENVVGSDHNDDIEGNGAANRIGGGGGQDRLSGLNGADILEGGDGDDVLEGGVGADALFGGDSFDMASYDGSVGGLTVDLSDSSNNTGVAIGDTYDSIIDLAGGGGSDILRGDDQDNFLWGSITANNAADMLEGGIGNDFLRGGFGADRLDGGDNRDWADYQDAGFGIVADLETGIGTGVAEDDIYISIENMVGGAFGDTLRGDGEDNELDGKLGDDELVGRGGMDGLFGGEGNDLLDGGEGNDELYGGRDVDTATYASAGAGVTVRLGRTTAQDTLGAGIDTLSSIENAVGSAFADALTGTTGANRLDGGGGRDNLLGGSGSDRLFGGDGNDVLNGAAGRDRLDGGTGIDGVTYAWTGSGVTVNLARTTAQDTRGAGVDTLASIENAVGSAFADAITGTAGINRLDGGGGHDRLAGGNGNDRLFGASGYDRVDGGEGADTLAGNAGIDRLTGGRQRDTMTGGADADMFLFDDGDTGAKHAAADRITDFSHAGGDRINLRAIDANTGMSGDQNFTFIGTGAFTDVAGQLRYEIVDGNAFVQGDTDGDGRADFFIRLDNVQTIDAADFVI